MVIWLIGKSGAGKSEIGSKLYTELKKEISNIVYLDGDELRNAISWDLDHSKEDRYKSEKRRSQLCRLLSNQGIIVICSALSNSPDLREWNKKNIRNYHEIYIRVKKGILYQRDSKSLYKKYKDKKIKNIVGEDIPFYEPDNPWLTIDNNGDSTPQKIVNTIIQIIKKDKIID